MALAVALAILAAGCSAQPQSTQVSERVIAAAGGTVSVGPASVTVEPGALLADGTITIELASSQQQVPEWNSGMIPVSDAVRIDLKGTRLQGPASVAISIDREEVPEGARADSVFLAFYDEQQGGWVPTESRYDPSTGLVSAATTHFSTWQARVPDTQVLSDLISDALAAVVRGLDIRAIPPDCDPEAPAFEMRGPIVGNDPPLIPCVEAPAGDSEVVMKIANNRAYSIFVADPAGDMSVVGVSGGTLQDELIRTLQRRLGSGVVLVPSGGTVEVALAIPPGEEVLLTTQSTWLTIGVDFIVAALSALAPGDIGLFQSGIACYRSTMGVASIDLGWEFALDAILAAVKDCISVVSDATVAELWGPVRDGITIGAAAGDLVRDHGINQDNNRLTIANLNVEVPPRLSDYGVTFNGVTVYMPESLRGCANAIEPCIVEASTDPALVDNDSVFIGTYGSGGYFGLVLFTNFTGSLDGLAPTTLVNEQCGDVDGIWLSTEASSRIVDSGPRAIAGHLGQFRRWELTCEEGGRVLYLRGWADPARRIAFVETYLDPNHEIMVATASVAG